MFSATPLPRALHRRLTHGVPLNALALAALLAGAAAQAQSLPNAGSVLQETRPAATPALPPRTAPRVVEPPARPTVNMPEGMTVTVTQFRVTGARSFPEELLTALVKPFLGRKLDINGLNEAAGAITRHYQAAGHLLTYAYLPAQRVADGVIEIAVLEGRLEGVQIVTAQDVRLRDEVIQAHTDALPKEPPLKQADVERRLLLLNDIPGVTARAAFAPGSTTGGADMVVSVAEDEPLDVRLDFSNHGTLSAGRYRAGVTVQLRDLFGWGDSTTARALISNRGALSSGSLGTVVPFGGDGYKVGASLSHLKYELAQPYRAVGAQGTADTAALDATYPLVRGTDGNLSVKGGYEFKKLRDQQLVVPETVVGGDNPKRSQSLGLSFAFDRRDGLLGGGAWAGSLSVSMGMLRLFNDASACADRLRDSRVCTTPPPVIDPSDPTQIALDYSTPGLRTAGEFRKLGVQLAREQVLSGPFSLYLRLAGQSASKNLDSSEKFALSGPDAVRAYAPGEASVDQGGLASLEARYALDYLGGNVVLGLFHDYGRGRINRVPIVPLVGAAPDNIARLSGSGLSVQWSGGGVGLNATLAFRGSRAPTADGTDPKPRLYFQLTVQP